MQGHLFFGDRDRAFGKIREAGFGWAKQQVRWSDFEKSRGNIDWGLLDAVVAQHRPSGTQVDVLRGYVPVLGTLGWQGRRSTEQL